MEKFKQFKALFRNKTIYSNWQGLRGGKEEEPFQWSLKMTQSFIWNSFFHFLEDDFWSNQQIADLFTLNYICFIERTINYDLSN